MSYIALAIAVMAIVTALIRFLPFWIFGGKRQTPPFVTWLGGVLPYAIMGMLVIYCLREVQPLAGSHGLPEAIAVLCVIGLQVWKRQSLLSILGGTVIYMILVQLVF